MKRIKLLPIITSSLLLFSGCSDKELKADANVFFYAVNNEDYNTAYNYTDLSRYEFITPEEFWDAYISYGYSAPQSNVKKVKEEDGYVEIIFENGNITNLPVVAYNGKLCYSFPDLYTTDVDITALSGSAITINGKEVSRSYVTGSDDVYDYYVIDALANVDNEITITNALDASTQTVNPEYNIVESSSVSSETSINALASFQSSLNRMYQLIEADAFTDEIKDYLPEEYSDRDLFDSFKKEVLKNRKLDEKYTSYHDVSITLEPQKDNVATTITSDTLSIPTIARMSWIVGEDYNYNAVYNINLTLKIDDNGDWRLAFMNDDAYKIIVDLRVE
jgi:hypothetical protein